MDDFEMEAQERLRLRIEQMIAQVMRADETAIIETVQAGREARLIDEQTATFLLMSRPLLLATTVGLSAAVDLHRLRFPTPKTPDIPVTCVSCGTEGRRQTLRKITDTFAVYLTAPVILTRAEAWRRADALFNKDAGADHFIGVHEIPDAYITWATPAHYPTRQPPAQPFVVIVDKHTGLLTQWPALPIPTLADRYHRYARGLFSDSEDESHLCSAIISICCMPGRRRAPHPAGAPCHRHAMVQGCAAPGPRPDALGAGPGREGRAAGPS